MDTLVGSCDCKESDVSYIEIATRSADESTSTIRVCKCEPCKLLIESRFRSTLEMIEKSKPQHIRNTFKGREYLAGYPTQYMSNVTYNNTNTQKGTKLSCISFNVMLNNELPMSTMIRCKISVWTLGTFRQNITYRSMLRKDSCASVMPTVRWRGYNRNIHCIENEMSRCEVEIDDTDHTYESFYTQSISRRVTIVDCYVLSGMTRDAYCYLMRNQSGNIRNAHTIYIYSPQRDLDRNASVAMRSMKVHRIMYSRDMSLPNTLTRYNMESPHCPSCIRVNIQHNPYTHTMLSIGSMVWRRGYGRNRSDTLITCSHDGSNGYVVYHVTEEREGMVLYAECTTEHSDIHDVVSGITPLLRNVDSLRMYGAGDESADGRSYVCSGGGIVTSYIRRGSNYTPDYRRGLTDTLRILGQRLGATYHPIRAVIDEYYDLNARDVSRAIGTYEDRVNVVEDASLINDEYNADGVCVVWICSHNDAEEIDLSMLDVSVDRSIVIVCPRRYRLLNPYVEGYVDEFCPYERVNISEHPMSCDASVWCVIVGLNVGMATGLRS